MGLHWYDVIVSHIDELSDVRDNLKSYKVRYVAKGYAQQLGIDCNKGYGQLCSVTSKPPSRLIDISLATPPLLPLVLPLLLFCPH